ncbi:MAG: threonine synthase [Alphaproteobacteria bacterium]|nr:threonine synthase [Alphaproteobacteria bacterium]
MKYRSTRSREPLVPLSAAMSAGLAPDGGLYVPTALPRVGDLRGRHGVADVAVGLLAPFFAGDVLEPELEAICHEALDIEVPLVEIDATTRLMELFHGPSAAFKDFGARFLASCMSRLQRGEDRPLTILVATSGDTGGAVAAAFHGKPGVEVIVLYPRGRVSERQAHQLSCWGGNVRTLSVEGDFDACQALVKAAFLDPACNARRRLSSANSINIGRLLPQMAYHAASALQLPGWSFVIPTGNLGNAVAAIWARRCGLPIADVVLATNANDTLVRFEQTGRLEPHDTIATLANAMDVSRPSNLERLMDLDGPMWDGVRALSVDDATIREVIAGSIARYGRPVCPHTACALKVREQIGMPCIVAATAHPSKFDTVVEPLIGQAVPVPPALAALLERPRHETTIPASLEALRDLL